MIFGPIKLLLKFFILILMFLLFVVIHNTDFGKDLEHKIGEALEYDNLKESAISAYRKLSGGSGKEALDSEKISREIKKKLEEVKKSGAGDKVSEKAEKILKEERKKLEEILESAGK